MPAANRNLRHVAVGHFSVHCIQRLFEPGIYESNYLTAELRDKSDILPNRLRRMLPPFSVAYRYRLTGRRRIALRIKAGMILSTFEERASNSVSIF
jgi:hypothetical protein